MDSGLGSLARDLGHADATTMLDRLRKEPDLALEQRVLEAMTTNETFWFRDRAPFEALRQHVLPELARSGAGARQLRIWSAACSSGQEIYSIALLLEEQFADRFAGWKVDLAYGPPSCQCQFRRPHRTGEHDRPQVTLIRAMPNYLLQNWRIHLSRFHIHQFCDAGTRCAPWARAGPNDLSPARAWRDLSSRHRLALRRQAAERSAPARR